MLDGSDPPLTIRLFGSFEVRVRGQPLPRLRSRKGQWLLALLVLHPAEELERDWLAGTLWPNSPQTMALTNLRGSLRDLRRALGPEAGRLRAPTRCVLTFDLDRVDVDVLAFDSAIARNEPPSLQEAISLYRRSLLERCAEEWVFLERQRREQAYLGALESLAVSSRDDGDLALAEQYLRRVVAVDPHRESAQRHLMQVLAASGDYAAALQTYRDLRLRLHRELNTAPDPQTQALFEQIRPVTDGRRSVSSPAILPIRQRAPCRPGRVPAPPTALIGRERELAAIQSRLLGESGRLLTLTGPGGVGKTHLALESALAVQRHFDDGAYLVNLAPVRNPDLVGSTVADTLFVEARKGQPIFETLKEYLQERQVLLLLDNFEHLLPAASVVTGLLSAGPRVRVLVTSRCPLHLRGEQLLPVPPLALPPLINGRPLTVDGSKGSRAGVHLPARSTLDQGRCTVGQYEAVQLFVERAYAVRPDFALTEENGAFVAEICRQLDGLPLAIELAAAQIRLLSPRSMLTRLENRLSLLKGGAQDLPHRQQTLRGAIEWSYGLLSEGEKQLFRRLTVFEGGCVLEAAESVCSGVSDLEVDVLDGVGTLLDKSLLRQVGSVDDEPRFGMLETIREFGRERLAASGEEQTLRRRHARHFRDWAGSVDQAGWGREGSVWLDRAEQEHNNLRAALTWALETAAQPEEKEAAELGLGLAAALSPFWSSRGHRKEAREWLAPLLALPGAKRRTTVWAHAFELFGDHVWELGEHREGLRLAEENLALWQEIGDRGGIARAFHELGWKHHIFDRHETACVLLKESLSLFQELGNRKGVADVLNGLGGLAYRTGDLDAASRFVQQAVGHYRELGDLRAMGGTIGNLALFAACRDDHESALQISREWIEIAEELRDPRLIVAALHRLGTSAFALGDLQNAKEFWNRALATSRPQGEPSNPSSLLNCLGGLARLQGELENALDLFGQARRWAEKLGPGDVTRISQLATATLGLADVACDEGNLETARARYRDAIDQWRQVNDRPAAPRLGPRLPIARCLHGLAKVALKGGEAERAARWFAAAAATRETLDVRLPVLEAVEWELCLEQVCGLLGEEAFATACEQGSRLPLDAAIAEAMEWARAE